MNAQTLINETPTEESFDYSVFFKSPIKSQIVISGGDKFVARQETKHPALVCKKVLSPLPSHSTQSLMPRTSDLLSKININNIKNTETFKGDVIRSMGIEVL